jgi:integrase
MKGSIYSRKRCKCGSSFKYDANKSGLFCVSCNAQSTGPFQVRFGKEIGRNFGNDFQKAEMFLLHLRHQTQTNAFDVRDYLESKPLGFVQQADIYLQRKKEVLKPKPYKNLEVVMRKAAKAWGNRNVKTIKAGDIEDFLFGLEGIKAKTRFNIKSNLHDFWNWLCDREEIPMPKFPEVPFKLGFRQIIDIETQQLIIDEVKRITYKTNPKAWLAIRMLARYFHIRPGELMRITEGNINLQIPAMILPPADSKIGEPVMIFLWEDDIEEITKFPRGLPDLPFFRHPINKRQEQGKPFGQKFLYRIWVRACKNLGLMRSETLPICDLYGGTRHSTMTAMSEFMSPEEIQQASGHRTNQALMRYLQGRSRYAQKATDVIADMQNRARSKDNSEIIQFNRKKA